eukprot:PITA_09567
MQEEYSSIMKNDVWEVVPRPEDKSLVTSKWLYKVKHVANGSIEKFKARFHMEDCKPMSTPMITNWKKLHASDSELVDPILYRQLIGCLMYLGTVDYGLDYREGDGKRLASYTNSDWAGFASDRKSTSGCCFGLGSTVVSWFSRKQQSVALSSVEAEYMAASLASCEAIWLRKMLFGLFGEPLRPSVIYCDNQSCIKLTENRVFHDKSKHIEIK